MPDLAMTGEVTLRGKVLPVGGVKEKVIAAKSAGIKRVILPTKNEKDLVDVSQPVREAMRFQFVDDIEQLLDLAFGDAIREAAAASATEVSAAEPTAESSPITVVVTQDIEEDSVDAPTA